MTPSQFAKSVQAHFDVAAPTYDQVFTDSWIGRAERNAVWRELDRAFHSGQRVLELNCGTGVDAVYLAQKGVNILACDLSPQMIEVARRRANPDRFQGQIDFRVMASEDIGSLSAEGPFEGAFSNFAGLNCVEDIAGIARSLGRLTKPGAPLLLCMAGSFVPWEMAWHLAHGNLRGALRRFNIGNDGGNVGSDSIKVQYPSVRTMTQLFAPEFRLREWKGIGVLMPPVHFERLARRFPGILHSVARADEWVGRCPGLRGTGGHVLLQFERTGELPELREGNRAYCRANQHSNSSTRE